MGRSILPKGTVRDTYFSLWTLTDKGINDSTALKATIETASEMIRDSKGECHFYVTIGGPCDFIGVAQGVDDTKIMAIQHAIKSFGTLRTEFIKASEFSLNDFGKYLDEIGRLHGLRPKPRPRG